MIHTTNPADILIVDDSPEMIHLLSQLLVETGHQIRATKESGMAVQIAESNPPDLFLLDIDMPGIDGYELCALFKTKKALQSIPVIFISAYDKPVNKIDAFNVGGVDYITKPIHAGELVSRVNTHIELFRLQQYLQQQVEEQTRELEDTLTALRIVAKQQKQETQEVKASILTNIDTLVAPLLERLKKSSLDKNQADIVDVLTTNLKQLSTPLIKKGDFLKKKLSPTEIQIANFIKGGKKTKEIASILNISELTISTHRKNIRKKLEISNRKIPLHTYLSSHD